MSSNTGQAMTPYSSPSDVSDTPTLGSLLHSIWRHWLLVVLITALSVGAAYGASQLQPEVYRSEARIFLTDPADTLNPDSARSRIDPEIYTTQQVTRVTAMPVLELAATRLDEQWSPQELASMTTAEPETESLVVKVGANAPTRRASTAIVRAVTQSYGELNENTASQRADAAIKEVRKSQKQLEKQVTEAQAELSRQPNDVLVEARAQTLTEQLLAAESTARTLAADASATGSGIDFVEEPQTAEEPIQPKPVRNAALGGAIGFVAAAALADMLTRRRRRSDPSTVLGAPLLAHIPDFSRSRVATAGGPLFDIEAVEAYQFLVASFEDAVARTQARSILVTSPSSGDGKSLTAVHLARALTMQGRNVMLVDADIRAHGLTSLLKAEEHPGLVSLADGAELHEVVRRYRISDGVRLQVVPSGQTPQNPTGLLATEEYRDALAEIIAANDLTVIDGGPLLTVADASALALQVSGILLVVDADISEEDLLAVQRRLRLFSTPLLGYVVNRSTDASPTRYPRASRSDRIWGDRDETPRQPAQHARTTVVDGDHRPTSMTHR